MRSNAPTNPVPVNPYPAYYGCELKLAGRCKRVSQIWHSV